MELESITIDSLGRSRRSCQILLTLILALSRNSLLADQRLFQSTEY